MPPQENCFDLCRRTGDRADLDGSIFARQDARSEVGLDAPALQSGYGGLHRLPLSVATLASRNCEPEHKGSTWKLLETMASPGKLYAAKLGWGALVLAVLLTIRSGLFLAAGIAQRLSRDNPPGGRFGLFTLIS